MKATSWGVRSALAVAVVWALGTGCATRETPLRVVRKTPPAPAS